MTKWKENFEVLDGVRSVACFAVVVAHLHVLYGQGFLLSTDKCMNDLMHVPVLGGAFFDLTWQMALFWLVSGLLCERSLHRFFNNTDCLLPKQGSSSNSCTLRQNDNDKIIINTFETSTSKILENELKMKYRIANRSILSPKWIASFQFLRKRLQRIYPPYFIGSMSIYIFRRAIKGNFTQLDVLFRTLMMMAVSPFHTKSATVFTALLWSLNVDFHGYVVATFLYAIFSVSPTPGIQEIHQHRIKKWIICCWYLAAVARWIYLKPFPEQWLDEEMLQKFFASSYIGSETDNPGFFGQQSKVYPNYDFQSPYVKSVKKYVVHTVEIYMSSITGHGSVFLLGNLLYINLIERQWSPSKYPLLKLIVAAIWLKLTRGYFFLCGVPVYLVLDVLLTLQPVNCDRSSILRSEAISNGLYYLFSNPLVKLVSPYTLAIYVCHIIPLFFSAKRLAPLRVDAVLKHGQDPCNSIPDGRGGYYYYGLKYVLMEGTKIFVSTFLVLYVLSIIYRSSRKWKNSRNNRT